MAMLQLDQINRLRHATGMPVLIINDDKAVVASDRANQGYIEILERAAALMTEAVTVQERKFVYDVVHAAIDWAKVKRLSKAHIKKGKTILNYARRHLGEVLKDSQRNRGAAGIGTSAVEHNDSTPPTLEQLGISRDLSSQAQRMAALSKVEFDAIVAGIATPIKDPQRLLKHLSPGAR